MSLIGFATLFAEQRDPQRRATIEALERQISGLVRRNPRAVIDERILSQQVNARIEWVKEALVALADRSALRVRLFWLCPTRPGTVLEEDDVNDFPLTYECENCGQLHHFRREEVDVRFLPSDELLREIAATQ